MPTLSVEGLTSRFRTKAGLVHAVNDVSFTVEPRTVVGVVGESGCGKSAMVRSILGLLPGNGYVESGHAYLGSQDLLGLSHKELRRIRATQLSFISQTPWGSLHPIIRLDRQFRNVIRAHRDATRQECEELALEWLERVRIPQPERVLRSYAHQLSGGMAQRVVIALSMLLDPDLVVADEPTTALDVTVQRKILDLIGDLVAGDDRAMLLVTHDIGVIAQYTQDVIVMYAGEVVEAGPTVDVLTKPAHPYTEALLRAVPRAAEQLAILSGSPPRLTSREDSCAFAGRCAYVQDDCRRARPALEAHGGARSVRCYHERAGLR